MPTELRSWLPLLECKNFAGGKVKGQRRLELMPRSAPPALNSSPPATSETRSTCALLAIRWVALTAWPLHTTHVTGESWHKAQLDLRMITLTPHSHPPTLQTVAPGKPACADVASVLGDFGVGGEVDEVDEVGAISFGQQLKGPSKVHVALTQCGNGVSS